MTRARAGNQRRVEIVGAMMGVEVIVLLQPRLTLWACVLIGIGVAMVSVFVTALTLELLASVNAPRLVATTMTIVLFVGSGAVVATLWSRLIESGANILAAVAAVVLSQVVFRLIVVTVERFIRSFEMLEVSLVAGLLGATMSSVAVVLLALTFPESIWGVLAGGAGLGYLNGVLSGLVLRGWFTSP